MAMNIKHVKGNLLRLAIPLTIITKTTDGGQETSITEDFIPNINYPITVRLGGSYLSYSFDATMDGNIAIMEDNGTLPKGVYQVEVLCKDDNGNNCRFMQRSVIDVVDATIEAGIVIGTEFEVETHYLDAAVFIRGEKGEKGDKGDKGEKGDKGDKGEKGDKGDKGEKGDKGDKGDQGIKGDKGEQGIQGIQGVKGDTGSQGERGLQGERGEKGDMGSIGKISISVDNTTGTPSATATASKAADGSTDISFSFKGIKGEKGENGAQGEQGIQGVKGDPFTYDDFTFEEIEGLKKPATDAANELNKYLDIVKLPVVETPSSETTIAMDANKVYDITIGESLTIILNAPTDLTVTNEYQGSFDTGSTAPTVTFPADVIWAGTPSVEANTHYEFNIRYTGGKYYGLVQPWKISTEGSA